MARTSGARTSTFAAKAACWPSAILHGNYTKANKHIALMNRMCRMACITYTSVTLRVTLRPAVACCCLAWLGWALWRIGMLTLRRTRSYEILHGLGDSQWSVAADYYQKARHAQSFQSTPRTLLRTMIVLEYLTHYSRKPDSAQVSLVAPSAPGRFKPSLTRAAHIAQ